MRLPDVFFLLDPEMKLPGGFFFSLSAPEMRLPGVIFLLAEVKLEFSPNCFQFLLAVLPHPLGD